MRNIWLTLSAIAVLSVLSSAVNADTLFDNTSTTVSGSDFIGTTYSYGPLADSFSTGSSSFAFNSLSLVLNALMPGDGDSFTISLLSDASTAPGSVLETFGTVADSSLATLHQTYTFTGPTFTLAANTRYWIELSSPNSSANWVWTTDDSGTNIASQSYFIAQQGGVFPDSDGPYLMSIPGIAITTTPEAGTLVTLAFGLGALLLISRKRVFSN